MLDQQLQQSDNSQATLIVVPRTSPSLATLDHEADFQDLDRVLFASEAQVRPFPWKLYRIVAP